MYELEVMLVLNLAATVLAVLLSETESDLVEE
jgi:hypothetical protein